MTKRKCTKGKTMIYKKKKKYRKLMIEQHQPYYKPLLLLQTCW